MGSEKGWSFRPVEGRRIETGVPVTDLRRCGVRTVLGRGRKDLRGRESSFSEMSGETSAIYAQALSVVKPKMSVSGVFAEVRNRMQESGLDFVADYGLGGGIGLSLQESPVITAKARRSSRRDVPGPARSSEGEVRSSRNGWQYVDRGQRRGGNRHPIVYSDKYPIPLLTSPLKGEKHRNLPPLHRPT